MIQYTVFKPNQKISGGAFAFNYNDNKQYAFLKVAPQVAEMPDKGDNSPDKPKVFSWEDKAINVKLGQTDLASLICVFERQTEKICLFHKTPSDNKIIEVAYVPDRTMFSFKVSQKVTGEDKADYVIIGITLPEAVLIKSFAQEAIKGIQSAVNTKPAKFKA